MSDTQTPIWQRWSQFRFSVIGELLFSHPPKEQQQTFSHLTMDDASSTLVPGNIKVVRNSKNCCRGLQILWKTRTGCKKFSRTKLWQTSI
jgi:hypothetical protein